MGKVFTITQGLENMGALRTGGQGSVYKGRRTGEIITAVKLLPTPIHSETQDDKHFTDFQNEVNKLKKVNQQPNPHVVRILSSGITDTGSFPFIEMEYVEGPDLEELLRPPHDPIFTVKEVIRVADQLSNALAHCHRVGVKHGDVKSNNVKYNVHTGNYVLLDFGMAIMSDEQRRTSLRHAGAIEFMAPEQNEGHILFQTDIYSFGVILFELITGTVPFPLKERGETARNHIMLAHMDTPPPDMLPLRKNAMPAGWSEEKKNREMQVPQWLTDMVYICLQKKPQSRFADGTMLHDHIILRSTQRGHLADSNDAVLGTGILQQQNEQLRRENEQLRQQVASLQQQSFQPASASSSYTTETPVQKKKWPVGMLPLLLVLAVLGVATYMMATGGFSKRTGQADSTRNAAIPEPIEQVGSFRVLSSRAYFHDEPDAATRREAFLVPSNEVITGLREKDGFIYTEFTNSRRQVSKGWLRRKDLLTLEEWAARKQPEEKPKLTPAQVETQLADARRLLEAGQTQEALFLYSYMSEQEVPEAMYEYGNLGLKKQAADLDCGRSYNLVKKASDKNYPAAKRTIGFLYVFADNPEVLRINNYDGCAYERNVFKGSKLLMEAVLAGDTTARRLMEELNLPDNTDQQEEQ